MNVRAKHYANVYLTQMGFFINEWQVSPVSELLIKVKSKTEC